jgi:hypothetical protein
VPSESGARFIGLFFFAKRWILVPGRHVWDVVNIISRLIGGGALGVVIARRVLIDSWRPR